jgi:hypothetical protein
MELYMITTERQSRLMKTVAAAMGADIQESSQQNVIKSGADLAALPIGIGYTKE